jgi:hypothetical protein
MLCQWCRRPLVLGEGLAPWTGFLVCEDCYRFHETNAARLIESFILAGRLKTRPFPGVPIDIVDRLFRERDIDDMSRGGEPWDL